MYMKMSQGNSLHSYLKQKCHFIFLLQNHRIGGQNRCYLGGLVPVGGGGCGDKV
jgi:hypothetical protein